ncbi:hypothetical protein J1614_006022 [Plenodomus biglobosus]|nr:hypothetical protein J1614_006022 [Plenodomus biglobosus]
MLSFSSVIARHLRLKGTYQSGTHNTTRSAAIVPKLGILVLANGIAVLVPRKEHATALVAERGPAAVFVLLAAQLALLVAFVHAAAAVRLVGGLGEDGRGRNDHGEDGDEDDGELHCVLEVDDTGVWVVWCSG